jgi:predicted O-methyltransferase YrrM
MNDPRAFLDQMSAGYQDATILLTANHLGVFAALAGGPRHPGDLAGDLACDPRALDLLLLALVGSGVLARDDTGRILLPTEHARYLDPDSPDTLHSILDHHFHLLARWVQLADVIRTGEPAPASEQPRTDRSLRAFICGMKDIARRSSLEVADAIKELGQCRRLLDLGGGPGTAALTFCRRWPDLTAVVFDLPDVVVIAEEEIAAAGLGDRVTTLAGDYATDPLLADGAAPYDGVYLSNIIHSLSEQETTLLLTRAAGVLAPGGLLLVKDFFLDDDRVRPAFGARFAVNMLVGTRGGKSYTWTETESLLAAIGLQNLRRYPVAAHSGVITARKSAS